MAGELVVEIHVPLVGQGGRLPTDPAYEFGWIDEIEEFLEDEADDGSFEIFDDGEELDGHYAFFVNGAGEDVLLGVARAVAGLPGIPSGVFAVVTDDEAAELGVGRRVALG